MLGVIGFSVLRCADGCQFGSFRIVAGFDAFERSRKMATQLSRDAQVQRARLVGVGDSHMEQLCIACLPGVTLNLGIGKETSADTLDRLHRYHALRQADAIVLAIGTNDWLQRKSPREFYDNVSKILARTSQHAPTLVLPIYPVAPERVQSHGDPRAISGAAKRRVPGRQGLSRSRHTARRRPRIPGRNVRFRRRCSSQRGGPRLGLACDRRRRRRRKSALTTTL